MLVYEIVEASDDKGILDVTGDFFKGIKDKVWGTDDDPEFEKMMLRAKIFKNNGYRLAFARRKLQQGFPKADITDINRALTKVGYPGSPVL